MSGILAYSLYLKMSNFSCVKVKKLCSAWFCSMQETTVQFLEGLVLMRPCHSQGERPLSNSRIGLHIFTYTLLRYSAFCKQVSPVDSCKSCLYTFRSSSDHQYVSQKDVACLKRCAAPISSSLEQTHGTGTLCKNCFVFLWLFFFLAVFIFNLEAKDKELWNLLCVLLALFSVCWYFCSGRFRVSVDDGMLSSEKCKLIQIFFKELNDSNV